jgi:protocatechuate 3,4-dioxygenase beta subunit
MIMQINKTQIVLAVICLNCSGHCFGIAQMNSGITLESGSTGRGYTLCGSCTEPKEVSSAVWLAPKDEPGEPTILSGTIYKQDGITPDSGVTLFLYQTDAAGYYHRPEESVFHPRLFGWLITGNDGRYEIHTVKPAPEILAPNEPAHIHVHIFGKGMKEHFLHEFWFQGDNHITADDKNKFAKLGAFSPVVNLSKDKDGNLKGVRNIRIRPVPEWKYEKD